METHIFICGAKSVGQYGGYETFVDKLTQYHHDRADLHYHVMCKANGAGCMDESRLTGAQKISDHEFLYHNARCVKLWVPKIGPAAAIYYDLAALRYCLRYCREHRIQRPIFYLLACRVGPAMGLVKKRVHALGGVLYDNPDGHEWMRSKWSLPVRQYWKLSERLTVKHADLLVCDSRFIESYIRKTYASFHPRTAYLAYGAEEGASLLSNSAPRFVDWLNRWGVKPFAYYLVVGRLVPENNYETILREFMASDTRRALILITDRNEGLLRRLEEKLRFSSDPRVRFAGTVYDEALLYKIRENAYAYLHGHEVGGTNPSLLEGLAATKVNLLYDVVFNREAGRDAALYWRKEQGSLLALLQRAEEMPEAEREALGRKAKARVGENYRWQMIADQYAALWQDAFVGK
ncbi:MAG: DUF1972 domain-containing protein, partial [Clostridia bacterium]|nr:DUF1972 domain-containing protein [Clostridia bacterium]